MTKQQFIQQAVISLVSGMGSVNVFEAENVWEAAEILWKTNPNKGSDPDNKKGSRFVPPTPQEVDIYIKEKGYQGFTGRQFCNHYQTKDWYVGKNKMKDWKAAVRTWGEKEKQSRVNSQSKLGFLGKK